MKILRKIANKCSQSIGCIMLLGIVLGCCLKTIYITYENNTKLPKIINCDEPSEKYLTIIKMNILNGMDDSEEEYKSLYTYWYQNAHPVSDLLPYALILANREHRSNDLSEYNDYIYNCLMSNESLMLLTDKLDTVTLAMAQKYRYK